MATKNNWISKYNKKAVDYFRNHGYTLTPGTRLTAFLPDCDGDGTGVGKKADVFFVDTCLSGRAFHQLMVDNGLLLDGGAPCTLFDHSYLW